MSEEKAREIYAQKLIKMFDGKIDLAIHFCTDKINYILTKEFPSPKEDESKIIYIKQTREYLIELTKNK